VGVANRNGGGDGTGYQFGGTGVPATGAIFVASMRLAKALGSARITSFKTGNLSSSLFKCFFNRQSGYVGFGFATNDSNIVLAQCYCRHRLPVLYGKWQHNIWQIHPGRIPY